MKIDKDNDNSGSSSSSFHSDPSESKSNPQNTTIGEFYEERASQATIGATTTNTASVMVKYVFAFLLFVSFVSDLEYGPSSKNHGVERMGEWSFIWCLKLTYEDKFEDDDAEEDGVEFPKEDA